MKEIEKQNTSYNIVSRVASFCGLRLSLWITAGILFLLFVVLSLSGYRTATPLYILLTCLLLPSLIHGAAFGQDNKKKEQERALPLPLFRKKYQYNSTKHICANISYLIVVLMFAVWHISCQGMDSPAFFTRIPISIALFSLFLRLIITISYRIYFQYFPLKAMR